MNTFETEPRAARRLPARARPHWQALGLAMLLLMAPALLSTAGGDYWVRVLDFALLYVMLALGLNIVVGFAGLLDLGYIAFYAVGAYTAALLSSPHLSQHIGWIGALWPTGLHL
ncbi:MAG: ABC transporter permease subunit, partial [Janthinobacterium lividum]